MKYAKNAERAKRIMDALATVYPNMDDDSMIADAITDLMHACDHPANPDEELEFTHLLARAERNYVAENRGPDVDSEI